MVTIELFLGVIKIGRNVLVTINYPVQIFKLFVWIFFIATFDHHEFRRQYRIVIILNKTYTCS